jgi:hypothetical protein
MRPETAISKSIGPGTGGVAPHNADGVESPALDVPAASARPAPDAQIAAAANNGQDRADGLVQPVGYAGPERWKATPIPCWGLRGTSPEDFEVIADRDTHTNGASSIRISSARSEGWGTIYQFADAAPMRGKRIEFTADIRSRDVARSAGLYVRIDGADGSALAIDNMWYGYGDKGEAGGIMNRSLSGDNEWTSTTLVLDVPPDAHALSLGLYLDGPGRAWLDNAHVEPVSNDTPITGFVRTPSMLEDMARFKLDEVPPGPNNLDFELGGGCGGQ